MRSLAFVLLASCAVVDTFDGHIDNRDNCCAAITAAEVRECLYDLADTVTQPADGWSRCTTVWCPTTGDLELFIDEAGEAQDRCPQ